MIQKEIKHCVTDAPIDKSIEFLVDWLMIASVAGLLL